jgi:putative selenate reductase
MAELVPYPFALLATRVLHELEARRSIFDLPERKFFLGDPNKSFKVRFHGREAGTPFGPAAGPHSQMAQNIVLSWLVGGRIFELKTVQILDQLEIPRPCIDMETVGYNAEWSQELRLEQSLEEYVKASMLIRILEQQLPVAEEMRPCVFDMSVGYDLAGIKSDRVQAFVAGMRDASTVVDRLRGELPPELRDLDFRTDLSSSLTLSTFHGCPPGEIERITEYLLQSGLDCVVKLNPTLLGADDLRRLLHGVLGYDEVIVPDSAFERDASWQQAEDFCGRLARKASSLGRSFGVKFSNTLICKNHREFFPDSVEEMYLSGTPLHVLAIGLVARFRGVFGSSIPISFSAGIDRQNFSDAVALGLVPVTVCSDLLKNGGYGRAQLYFKELAKRMDAAGATSIDQFVQESALSADAYLARLLEEPRYRAEQNRKGPKRIAKELARFDCVTCDICIPVCPNDANFTFVPPERELPIVTARKSEQGWQFDSGGKLVLGERHQIGTFADFCNECGNCDVFCPETGAPYALKPRFFGRRADFEKFADREGFCLEAANGSQRVLGRFSTGVFTLELSGDQARYDGPGFSVRFVPGELEQTLAGDAVVSVDFTYYRIMDLLRRGLLDQDGVGYVAALARTAEP